MNTEISQIPLAPIATIVAALITGVISFVSLTLNKEQKISEFRQSWINGLRDELATFFSSARALSRTMQEARSPQSNDPDVKGFTFGKEKVGHMRLATADSLYKIKLRLNKNEAEHEELERLILSAIGIQNRLNQEKALDYQPALDALDLASDFARDVLKKEWEIVKKGERSFRVTKNGILLAIIALFGILLFFIFQQKEESNQTVDTTAISAPH